MRRNMWFGRGAAHLLSEGVFFGRERKSHRRRELIVACVGGFSPWGTASSRFWRRSRTHRQKPTCDYVAKSVKLGTSIAKSSPQSI
jgi:hypothetical protein